MSTSQRGVLIYTFDSARDFFMTSRQWIDRNGATLIDTRIQPKKVGEVWLAGKVDEFNPLNDSEFHLSVLRAEVNVAIPDSEFDFETLEFDKTKARMERYTRGNVEPTLMVWREGRWLPNELLEQLEPIKSE